VLCLALASCKKAATEEQKKAPPDVTVAAPVVRPVTPYEEFTGTTEAVDSVDVRARVSGYLDDICFQAGDELTEKDVEAKKVLFKIDPRPYDVALKKAAAELTAAKTRAARLKIEAERDRVLLAKKTISQEEHDRTQANWQEAEAAVLAADAARARTALDVTYTQVVAQMPGQLSKNLISKGNMVTADTTLLTTIVAVEKIYAYFDVDERRYLRLQNLANEAEAVKAKEQAKKPKEAAGGEADNDQVDVYLAIGDSKDYRLKGHLNFTEPRVNPDTGTKQVRAEFDNPRIGKQSRELTPGLFVRLCVPIGKPQPAVLVADAAIASAQGQKYVWVIDDKNIARRRMVQLGRLEGQLRVIEQGLQAGERVVVNGLQKVREDQPVTPQKGTMPGDEPKADKP
jgi:RND family efflux transporter MFP subunit